MRYCICRLRLLISSFEAALGQLRSTISQLLQSLPSQPSGTGDCDVPPYQLLIDLGSDPRRRSLSPFSSQAFATMIPPVGSALRGKGQRGKSDVSTSLGVTGGIYFEIETYVGQHSTKSASSVPVAVSTPATLTTTRSDSQRIRNHTGSSSSSSGSSRRRHKGTIGIILDAGHFEYLIEACRTSGADRRSDVIAMGMRIKSDAITSFLLKSEEKKLEADERNRKARKNKHLDKEKVQESISTHPSLSCGDSRLDAFLSKRIYASPDAVVAVHTVSPFGVGQSMRSGLHTTAAQTTGDVATHSTHSLFTQPHAFSSTHSSMVTVTLSRLRASGFKATDSDAFLKNRSPDLSSPKHSSECNTDFLISQCYHATVPFLVVLDDKMKPSVEHDIVDIDKEWNHFSALKTYPVQVQDPPSFPSFHFSPHLSSVLGHLASLYSD